MRIRHFVGVLVLLVGWAGGLHGQAVTEVPGRSLDRPGAPGGTGPLPPLPVTLQPLMDYPMRDISICLGPDKTYYMTGTTGSPDWWAVTGDIRVWKSPDLQRWTPVVMRPRPRATVWNVDRDGTWQKPIAMRDGAPFRPVWAPQIHYFKDTFWLTYSIPGAGSGILRSTSGAAEGPYVKVLEPEAPLVPNIDLMLFQDTDGKVYAAFAGGMVAAMRDDMTGLAETPWKVTPSDATRVGFEGAFLFKATGRYYMAAAEFVNGEYHCYMASADNVRGPYGPRYLAIPHGGHASFFKDNDGEWWCTFFGNDPRAPFRERPGAMKIAFSSDGHIRPKIPRSQQAEKKP